LKTFRGSDLDPIEEARAYTKLMEVSGATQERIAEMVGKSRVAVSNTMRLLKLSDTIQAAIKQGVISSGHARALLAIDDANARNTLFDRICKGNLSVRQAEQEAQKLQGAADGKNATQKRARSAGSENLEQPLDPLLKDLREHLIERFGTKVEISGNIDTGFIKIQYFSQEDLQRIYDVLKLE
jgi:Predicted transcriptional regulators